MASRCWWPSSCKPRHICGMYLQSWQCVDPLRTLCASRYCRANTNKISLAHEPKATYQLNEPIHWDHKSCSSNMGTKCMHNTHTHNLSKIPNAKSTHTSWTGQSSHICTTWQCVLSPFSLSLFSLLAPVNWVSTAKRCCSEVFHCLWRLLLLQPRCLLDVSFSSPLSYTALAVRTTLQPRCISL